MEKRQEERSLADSLLYIPAITFLVYFILHALFVIPRDDDLWVLQYCISKSFSADFSFWWHHNNGRYASAFFQLVFFRLPQPFIAISSAIFVLGTNFLSVRMLFGTLIKNGLIKAGNTLLFSILTVAAIYFSSPHTGDVFFWPSSVFVHGLSVAAFIFICIYLFTQDNLRLLIAIVSAIFLGGASETAALLSIFILTSGTIFLRVNPRNTIILLFILTGGLTIHYFAPASQIRSEELINAAPQGILKAIAVVVFYDALRIIISFAILTLMLLPFVRISSISLKKKLTSKIAFLYPLLAAIPYFIFIAYIMRDLEPARALQPLILFLFLPGLYITRYTEKMSPPLLIMPSILISMWYLISIVFLKA